MPQRNATELKTNELFYVRKEGTNKIYSLFSVEQLQEHLDTDRITEKDFVGKMKSKEGLGGDRGTKKATPDTPVRILSSSCPWTISKGAK